jgi:plastocyanin
MGFALLKPLRHASPMTAVHENLSSSILVTTVLSLLIFGIIIQNASATTSEIRILADLNPPPSGAGIAADGRADYRERGSSMRLNVEIEDATPNSTFTIEVSGELISTITTNSFGIAELELNTNDGQVVPKVLRGDLIQIFQGSELVLGGSFDDGNIEDDDNQTPIISAENITSNQNPPTQADNPSTNSSAITTVITIPQDADDRGANGAYSPNPASVTDRSTVTWNNIDSTPHSATADDGSFDTGIINGGSSGSAIISANSETTVIRYHCSVHPEMRGTLQVISLSTVPSSNTTLQNAPVTSVNSSANATVQNLQQEIVALQQTVDALQQALTSLQQAASQGGNFTISADNNTTAISIPEELQQQQSTATPLPPQQMPESQQQQNQTVSIVPGSSRLTDNGGFEPNPIQIQVGDTVTWINSDLEPHTVTSGSNGVPDNKFNSSPDFIPLMAPSATFSHTFTETGEYPYFCLLHPNMVGTVSVVS